MSGHGDIDVREMTLSEIDLRIDYFHASSDAHVETLGVDRSLLPEPENLAGTTSTMLASTSSWTTSVSGFSFRSCTR